MISLLITGVLIGAPEAAAGKMREKPIFSDGSARYAGGVGAAGEEELDLGIWEPETGTETGGEGSGEEKTGETPEGSIPGGGTEEETESATEAAELGQKIFIDAPEGFQIDESGPSIFQQLTLISGDCSITVSILQNTNIEHEVEKEVQSKRRRIKRIISDKEIQAGQRQGRYVETYVIRGEAEYYYYIGLMELNGEVIKYNAVTTGHEDEMEERIRQVMSGTYYAYWQ